MLTVSSVQAQDFATATPVSIDLFNSVPAAEQFENTATPTRTPTPAAPAQIIAKEGTVNVRAQPDPEAEKLGEIREGEYYNAIRRYYRWIELQFDAAPSRRGWVYDELVNIVGDASAIPQVDSLIAPTQDAAFNMASTELAITQTPGALLTATAISRGGQIAIEQSGTSESEISLNELVVLPTFTYPPGIVPIAPTARVVEVALEPTDAPPLLLDVSDPNRIPPIVPIIGLAGLGLAGFLISAMRR